jgi:hypothetical protein
MAATDLTPARARELLRYDRDTGELFWLVRTSNRITVGRVAGSKHCAGYVQICVDGKMHLAHRLIWLHVHGTWPQFEVDHINGMRSDNRIANLRDIPAAVNMQNMRHASTRSRSGVLGVSWSAKDEVWVANISLGNRARCIGRFNSIDEAQAAYLRAKRELHPGCTI